MLPVPTPSGNPSQEWLASVGDDLMHAIVDASPDAIYSSSIEGNALSWNPVAEQLFGFRASEVIGNAIDRFLPEEVQSEHARRLQDVQREESPDHIVAKWRTKRDEAITVSISSHLLRDASGKVVGVLSIARNLTEALRQAEELALKENALSPILFT